HEKFPDRAKTAVGILRYGDQDVVGVIDREQAGTRVSEFGLRDVDDAPVVASIDDVPECDALIIGVAPIGGGFEDSWRPDVRAALERGCDVIAGLHYFLNDDAEFARLAEEHGAELRDVRRPPEDLTVADGTAGDVDAEVVLTVGTDCSSGKMTTTMELVEAARERGVDAAAVPTGQTGIMIEGWGVAVDRAVSDFTAGAVERMVERVGDDHDLLVVEGQGSIVHPAYSAVTTGILHGAQPDGLVLCHVAGREAVHGYESYALPPLSTFVDLYEDLAAPVHETEVLAGALNTAGIDDEVAARETLREYAEAIDAPAIDPVRFGPDAALEAIGERLEVDL
ncbi:MAG: DUF1611 domain-containing protein, partial [Halobacteriales archaeon]